VSRWRAAGEASLAGASVSLGLFAVDAASLGRLSVAGVSDAVAQERLLALARSRASSRRAAEPGDSCLPPPSRSRSSFWPGSA
jgi:hypothetical protein